MVALGFTVYIGARCSMPSEDILPLHVCGRNHMTVHLYFLSPTLGAAVAFSVLNPAIHCYHYYF